ncbi:methyl-accepting chemotaxis protein [Nucisporomicrobium flavum]|uniref:methyl-accepting chemotaxis protein n=1 Tax=Nucisporomicrobium flavum TaxID=2785915 RepID=UPI0018F576D6|nr:methyl-accepting chemotaxis protein [Nucisporomicrobium flavum]
MNESRDDLAAPATSSGAPEGSLPVPRPTIAFLAIGVLVLSVMWIQTVTGAGRDSDMFATWFFNAVLLCGALACIITAVLRPNHRLIAGVMGAGLLLDAIGGLVAWLIERNGELSTPSLADALWLSIYPAEYVVLLLLMRRRIGRATVTAKLDGVLSGLAIASVVVCVSLPVTLSDDSDAGFWVNATNLSYPIADLILLGVVVSALSLNNWKVDRRWAVLICAVLAWETADLLYLGIVAYLDRFGDVLVLSGALGVATAVTCFTDRPLPENDSDRGLLSPVIFCLLPLGVLVLGGPLQLTMVGVVLAGLALLVALVRMAITLKQNQRMIASNRAQLQEQRRTQESLQATLTERNQLDEQMRTLLDDQRAAEERSRVRAQRLLSETNTLVAGPLSRVVDQVRTVEQTATSIDGQVSTADNVAAGVVEQAHDVDRAVAVLAESLQRIGGVATVISGLADQTNLLALNATIESARAGEAGKSFSIVAAEVKELSRDTAKFTDEIAVIIESLRTDAGAVTSAITSMTAGINRISSVTAVIRNEVAQQREALGHLTRQAQQATAQARRIGDEDRDSAGAHVGAAI